MSLLKGFVWVLLFACAVWAAGDTTEITSLNGTVYLSASRSPYIVKKSLLQGPDDTLLAYPGVQVFVVGYHKIVLHGTVQIQGTARKPVRFSTLDSDDTWMGFLFETGSNAVLLNGLVVENAFRNTFRGVTGVLQISRIINNYYGIWIENSPGFKMTNCEFRENRYGLTGAEGVFSLDKSKIQANEYGIWLESTSSYTGKSNQVTKNQTANISSPNDPSRQSASQRYPRAVLQGLEARF